MFMHHTIMHRYLIKNAVDVNTSKVMTFYTHSRDIPEGEINQFLNSFNKIHKVIFMCTRYKKPWLDKGLAIERSAVALGGADKDFFYYHERRKEQYVGLCSSFYERKNPTLINKL